MNLNGGYANRKLSSPEGCPRRLSSNLFMCQKSKIWVGDDDINASYNHAFLERERGEGEGEEREERERETCSKEAECCYGAHISILVLPFHPGSQSDTFLSSIHPSIRPSIQPMIFPPLN